MNKQYLSLLLLVSFVAPSVQSSVLIPAGALASQASRLAQQAANSTTSISIAEAVANAGAGAARQRAIETAKIGFYTAAPKSGFQAGLSALGKQFVKLGNYPKTFLGGSTVVAAGTSAGTFAAAQDAAQYPVVSAPVVSAPVVSAPVVSAPVVPTPIVSQQELTRLMEVETSAQQVAQGIARDWKASTAEIDKALSTSTVKDAGYCSITEIAKEQARAYKAKEIAEAKKAAFDNSYVGKAWNTVVANKDSLIKGAVAGAAGLTTGGLTYAVMKKFNGVENKKTNIAASAVVGAATTAGTFVKYDALSNALSSIKTPAFVTSAVDYVKPGFSYVGNTVMNNKVVAGTVLGAVVVGGLAYAFRNKLANMLSTSQSNTVEQNQNLLTSKTAELVLLNSNLAALNGSASSYACSPDQARFLANVATVKTQIAACEKQIADVQTTIATQQEAAAAA